MKKPLTFLCLCFLFHLPLFSQFSLQERAIPDSLKKNAHAIVRFSHTNYSRESSEVMICRVHYAITVLNEKAMKYADLILPSSEFLLINRVKCIVYNNLGKETEVVSQSKFTPLSNPTELDRFIDRREFYFHPSRLEFPFTVEYDYELQILNTAWFQPWWPVQDYYCSVEQAELSYQSSPEWTIKSKSENYNFDFDQKEIQEVITSTWSIDNMPAITEEYFAPSYREIFPVVYLAPARFSFKETMGDFSSWPSMGTWVCGLNAGRDVLSLKTQNLIHQMTDSIPSIMQKTLIIYKYMQSRTRYMDVSTGIGGFQPISALSTDLNAYGDCKALSNYTMAMLKVAGIESNYLILGSGATKITYADFSSLDQANHAMIVVPCGKDSIWLECTSQTLPFGYRISNNSSRLALIINNSTGVLVKTPPQTNNNEYSNTAVARIDEAGKLTMECKSTLKGVFCENNFEMLNYSKKEQQDTLLQNIPIDNLHIDSFSICYKTEEMAIVQRVNGNAEHFASTGGQKFFTDINLFNRISINLDVTSKRKYDIEIKAAKKQYDTITLSIPDACLFNFVPENISITGMFGNYSASYAAQGNTIIYIRYFELYKGRYERNQYPEFCGFINKVRFADDKKIIFSKSTPPDIK